MTKIEVLPEPDINFKVNGINCYTLGVILQKYYNYLIENNFVSYLYYLLVSISYNMIVFQAFGTSVNMQEVFLKVKIESTVENDNCEADSKSNDCDIGLISPNIDESGGKPCYILQNDSSTTKSDDAATCKYHDID